MKGAWFGLSEYVYLYVYLFIVIFSLFGGRGDYFCLFLGGGGFFLLFIGGEVILSEMFSREGGGYRVCSLVSFFSGWEGSF